MKYKNKFYLLKYLIFVYEYIKLNKYYIIEYIIINKHIIQSSDIKIY